jgi:hypothetical protein
MKYIGKLRVRKLHINCVTFATIVFVLMTLNDAYTRGKHAIMNELFNDPEDFMESINLNAADLLNII